MSNISRTHDRDNLLKYVGRKPNALASWRTTVHRTGSFVIKLMQVYHMQYMCVNPYVYNAVLFTLDGTRR